MTYAISLFAEDTNDSILCQTSDFKITQISSNNLLKSFTFETNSPKITAFECQPNDWSNIYCGTDNGLILRCARVEESVSTLPATYTKSQISGQWSQVSVISFNKSEANRFLASFTDGIVCYYSIAKPTPLVVFNANETPIIDLKWIPNSCDKSFIALNNSNQILVWDLSDSSEQNLRPRIKFRHSNDR